MTGDQTFNILIGILFLIVIGFLRRSRGTGWG
jgi:hypothetical protein